MRIMPRLTKKMMPMVNENVYDDANDVNNDEVNNEYGNDEVDDVNGD